jgi:hypothetical protein
MTTITDIENTKAFKSIKDDLRRLMILKKSTRNLIIDGCKMTAVVGFERWCEFSYPSENVKAIVKELCAKD